MNNLEFTFEQSPWEGVFAGLEDGGSLSAVRFLALLEGESEEDVEAAFQSLEERRITLDVTELPGIAASGDTAVRLRQEAQLVEQGILLSGLEETDPLRVYLEELALIPACGDVNVLAMDALAGDDSARAMLTNLSLSRVIELAQEHVGRGVLLLDLIQEGSLGLWQGILNFEGGAFEEMRDWWIRQYMAREITLQARAGGVGQKMRQAAEDYRAVDERLLTELGRNPTMEEMAEGLHMSVEETVAVRDLLENMKIVQRAHAEPKQESEEDDQAVEDTAYYQSRQRVNDMLSGLEPKEAELLTLRFGLEGGKPLSPEEAGRKLGMTPAEVVAMEAAALAKLRH